MTLGLLEFLSEYTQMDCESNKETVFWKARDDCNPIKEEFEHNVTQQLYVSKTAWDAVTNFKEKNILLIHQAAATLPVGAGAGELNRLLISFLGSDPAGDMHQLVSEVLSLEVKQIL